MGAWQVHQGTGIHHTPSHKDRRSGKKSLPPKTWTGEAMCNRVIILCGWVLLFAPGLCAQGIDSNREQPAFDVSQLPL